MNLKIILFALTLLALLIDGTVVSLPIFFALALTFYFLYPDESTVLFLFVAGMILDITRVTTVGSTTLLMLVVFTIIYICRHTAEINDYKLIAGIVFLTTFIYAMLFNYNTNIVTYILIFALVVGIYSYFGRKVSSYIRINSN